MLQSVERGFFKPSRIQLSVGATAMPQSKMNPDVQILRVGKFNHPKYGEFEITKLTLNEMKSNFDKKIRGIDIAFDYFHNSDEEASGWPTELFLNEDETELWAKVDWTQKAQAKLAEREIRYFSPDFAFQWQDPETGEVFKNVLFGGGLTNRPFVKDMAAIVAAENKGGTMNELEKLKEQVLKLAEDAKKKDSEVEDLKKKLAEAQKPEDAAADGDDQEPADKPKSVEEQLAEMTKKCEEYAESNKKLLAEKSKLEEAKVMAEKETKFNLLLTEGKACVAQKEAYLKGDMNEFIKLAQHVNLDPKGSKSNDGGDTGDRDDKVLKLAEEKMKADSKLSKIDAISLANKEVK